MPLGLILVGWDQKIGSIIDATYPSSFSISREIINKILMTHGFNKEMEPELLEIKYSKYIIFSYCDKTKVPIYGYEMVMLILDEKEELNTFDLKNRFKEVEKLGRTGREKRIQEFLTFSMDFFKKRLSKKILIIGLPSTGKTCIKDVFFEGNDAKKLLEIPLEPTRGFSYYLYNWLDMELGMADSSGQEINSYFIPGPEQKLAFSDCDVVIYNFDYVRWINDKDIIFKNIEKLIKIAKGFSKSVKIFAFCHKIDLIEEDRRVTIYSKIMDEFKGKFDIHLFFTSIEKRFIHLLYKAMQEILNSLSPLSVEIGKILFNTIGHCPRTLGLLLSKQGNIINQFISSDYNFSNGMILKEYYLKANLILRKIKGNRIRSAQIIGIHNLNIIIKNIVGIHNDIESLIIVSESMNQMELKKYGEKIEHKLNILEIPKEEMILND
ncbi:MAG: hypothetical protein ACTSWY_16030 [Promethearchaeota archaeon]